MPFYSTLKSLLNECIFLKDLFFQVMHFKVGMFRSDNLEKLGKKSILS